MIEKFIFDVDQDQTYYAYRLSNEDLAVVVLEYGAIIQSFKVLKTEREIVLNYPRIKPYLADKTSYLGAIIGRYCNRIGAASYVWAEQLYQLTANAGPNCLHGGETGFNQQLFQAQIKADQLILSYASPALEAGFGGDLGLKVTYELANSALIFQAEVTSQAGSIYNITQHSYFNLTNQTSILDHHLAIFADQLAFNDDTGLAVLPPVKVNNQPFDFRHSQPLKESLATLAQLAQFHLGLDHHFIVPATGLRKMAELTADQLVLTIKSDLPGLQVYTGNYLDQTNYFLKQAGICFETQYFPNNINNGFLPQSILKPHESKIQRTIYEIEVKQ